MKVVGAALRYGLNVATTRTAEGGLIKRSLHLEFLNGLGRWNRQALGVVISYVVGIHAVDLVIVLRSACAVDRNVL